MAGGIFNLHFMGRAGNTLFQYAFARAYAERHGLELRTDPWWGHRVFAIEDGPIERELPMRDENTLVDGERDVAYRSYSQQQKCLIYTRADVRRWLTLRDDVRSRADAYPTRQILAHRRVGDYIGYGYPVVTEESYRQAARDFGFDPQEICFVTEEDPLRDPFFDGFAEFMPDFLRLMRAPVLFRANSSFSWWAGTLGVLPDRVFSPIIDGLEGGRTHDCTFVQGNWPRLAHWAFTTDLYLPE